MSLKKSKPFIPEEHFEEFKLHQKKLEEKNTIEIKKRISEIMEFIDSNPQNIKIKKRFYYYSGVHFNRKFFDTEEELIDYAKHDNLSYDISVVDFIEQVGKYHNVIRYGYRDKFLYYTMVNEELYQLNVSQDKVNVICIWNTCNLDEEYAALEERGLIDNNGKYIEFRKQREKWLRSRYISSFRL